MGKGRLPLGHTGDTLSALVFGILPSIGPRSSFLAVWVRNSPYGRFNWKPVLGEGQARERRIRHRSFVGWRPGAGGSYAYTEGLASLATEPFERVAKPREQSDESATGSFQ
jgi:hypothetical protein